MADKFATVAVRISTHDEICRVKDLIGISIAKLVEDAWEAYLPELADTIRQAEQRKAIRRRT